MQQPNHDDEVFRKKRILKNPIKFKISLNDEQKKAKEDIINNTITLLAGKAGSGKTLLGCQIGLEGIFTKEYEKIIIARPTVSTENIGFLPGNIKEKMDSWVQPIYQNMYSLYDKEKVDQCINTGKIQIMPLSFMRGITFLDSIIIIDEAQNVTHEQMKMIVTRIGLHSKMIICGDISQIDLRDKSQSGFSFLFNHAKNINGLATITLNTNHRNPIVDELLHIYETEKINIFV